MTRAALILTALLVVVGGVVVLTLQTCASPKVDGAPPWFLTGRVTGPDERPLVGATVGLYIRRGSQITWFPSVQTDAVGRYRADLAPIAAWSMLERATGEVYVYAHADGFVPERLGEFRLDEAAPGTDIERDLVLVSGFRVRGRVVDETGEPLVRAEVWLASTPSADHHSACDTDHAGHFVVGGPVAGDYELAAGVFERGAVAEPLKLTLGDQGTIDLGDIVVRPEALIEGVVVLKDGTPVPGVSVWAQEAVEPPSDGPATSSTTTDAVGHFRLPVQTGRRYGVHVAGYLDDDGYASCEAGERKARIAVHAALLVVHVVDPAGRPLPGADVDFTCWSPSEKDTPARLMAGEITPAEAKQLWYTGQAGMIGGHTETFLVESGSPCHVSASVPGGVPAEAAVTFGPDQTRAEVTLVIRETAPTGTLALTLTGTDGKPIDTYAVEVTTLSGLELEAFVVKSGAAPPPVPAGRVRLVVVPGATVRWPLDKERLASSYLPLLREVNVPAGGTLPLALRAMEGGRMRLRMVFPGGGRRGGEWVTVDIQPASDPATPPRRLKDWREPEGEEHEWSNLFPDAGPSLEATLFEPGEYILAVKAAYAGEHTHRFSIRPAEITDVVVDLTR